MTETSQQNAPASQPDERASEVMLICRAMADEMAAFLGKMADEFADTSDARMDVLASAPGEAILRERVERLLALDRWDREQLLELSGTFFLLATTTKTKGGD